MSSTARVHLDAVRGLAALAVMWGHLRALFFVDLADTERPGLATTLIYVSAGWGHQAVMVFFVLSGYLITSAALRRLSAGTWTAGGYAIDRLCRLYVVLVPGLLLGLFWDRLGLAIFSGSRLYTRPLEALGPGIAAQRLGIETLFGNLFFLQTILCPTFGSNGPLWSLANEFWYYVLLPLGIAAWHSLTIHRPLRALAFVGAAFAVITFIGPNIASGFLVWLAGATVAFLHGRQSNAPVHVSWRQFALPLGIFGAFLVASRLGYVVGLYADLTVGLGFALLLRQLVRTNSNEPPAFYGQTARLIAGSSYTLYVVHFPFLLFLRAWLLPNGRWQPDLANAALALAVAGATLVLALLVASVTERQTGSLRAQLGRALGSRQIRANNV